MHGSKAKKSFCIFFNGRDNSIKDDVITKQQKRFRRRERGMLLVLFPGAQRSWELVEHVKGLALTEDSVCACHCQ